MSQKDDGGPVHPTRARMETEYIGVSAGSGAVTIQQAEHTGLSLRDYFAAKALAGLLASPADGPSDNLDGHTQHYARVSYSYADAMLKERAK